MSLLLLVTCKKIRIHHYIKRLRLHNSQTLFYLSRGKCSCFLISFWKTIFFLFQSDIRLLYRNLHCLLISKENMPKYTFQPAHAYGTWRLTFKFSFPIIHLYTQHVVDDSKLFISLKKHFFSYNRSFHYFDIDTTIIEYLLCREQCRTLYCKTSILIITQHQMLFTWSVSALVGISLIILNRWKSVFHFCKCSSDIYHGN